MSEPVAEEMKKSKRNYLMRQSYEITRDQGTLSLTGCTTPATTQQKQYYMRRDISQRPTQGRLLNSENTL
jgi:hypothetical protein